MRRDRQCLRIHDARDGRVLYEKPCETQVGAEPVVADVDADGSAEIVVFTGTAMEVIGRTDHSWADTREIWNICDYHVTNINENKYGVRPIMY